MPLIHFIDKPKYTVGIWKIEEQEYNAEFSKVLHPNYHNDIQNYKNIKRKWQIHASKLLFEHLLPGESLSLNEKKPIINNCNKHVSIAHTQDIIAMIIAKFPCGIDIEIADRDASKIQHKFLNKSDFTSGETQSNLLKNWCAKEVLYKIKGEKSILFSNHLVVTKNGNLFSGHCKHPKFNFKSTIKIFNFENYCLAFNTNYKD